MADLLKDLNRVRELLEGYCQHSRNAEGCSDHPDAPHGFDRNGSHSEDRYVCDCEGWEPDPCADHACVQAVFAWFRAHAAEIEAAARDAQRLRAAPVVVIETTHDGYDIQGVTDADYEAFCGMPEGAVRIVLAGDGNG